MDTIGGIAHKAKQDTNDYSVFDISNEWAKSIEPQIVECVDKHKDMFDTDEFCVVMLIGSDPLLTNMIRRKFYAWPFLPKPRPSQTVWMYNKITNKLKMLWCLPAAETLASLTTVLVVDPAYKNMQRWSHMFYTTKFWPGIRNEHDIKMLSEEEHLEVMREKGTHSLAYDCSPSVTNPFDTRNIDTE